MPPGEYMKEVVTSAQLLVGGRAPKDLQRFARVIKESYESAVSGLSVVQVGLEGQLP